MNFFSFFTKGNSRSIKAKKNILASFLLKAIDGFVYLAVVPITLGFLDPYTYGLWLSINSILVWINSFDIGLSNGLRNCLTIAVAKNNFKEARIYISTTYFLLSVLVLVLFLVFVITNHFLDWYTILNVEKKLIPNLNEVILYSFIFFCLTFVLRIIGSIYTAMQSPAISSLFKALSYIFSLVLMIVYKYTMNNGSLMLVALTFSVTPCIVYIVATIITFMKVYNDLSPSFFLIKIRGYVNKLLTVGVNFFIMQMCVLVLQFTTNILISHFFGPTQVTIYNIANRYMFIGILLMTILLSPVWSAVTDALAKNDWLWIRNAKKKVEKIVFLLGIFLLFLVTVSNYVYKLWVGTEIHIPMKMTVLNAIYVFLLIWSTSQSTFLNGMNILRVQLIMYIIQTVLYFPVVILLGEKFGASGLVMGLILVNIPAALTNTIQLRKIVKKTATGIWLK